MDKIVLAYSGGLDTSVAIKWIKENYKMDVIALTINVGGMEQKNLDAIKQKALDVGAVAAYMVDARQAFVDEYVWPALKANAIYESYPLATALARPLIAKLLAETAIKDGATAVAHGSTGKGNDQVRFEVGVMALAPELKIYAPAREWGMSREQSIEYAKANGIPVPVTVASPYSVDENLWGRSCECGVLEDPWAEPPEGAYDWTVSPESAPDKPEYIEVEFEKGIPIALNGEKLDGITLIESMNKLAGAHGVGRLDNVESRLVGIKSREIYEAPAGVVLILAHQALEALTLSRYQLGYKAKVALEYADLTYNGLWFSAHRRDLAAYIDSTQRHVSGTVRIKLYKGTATIVGRKSPYSLYSYDLATYDEQDQFDHSNAEGFIRIWGLAVKTQTQVQGQAED
ncbi:MAG: argininosuccinate synthase [Chloroflexi bacterium]|jgi:argininosuccinate synthase|nr:argininosuccinate synthase [Chloroflexota bacterium]MBT7080442.1 argininosuccinate synthase [Chloroflexota bacterium]MBT7290220.1 argininosuccinate synthase [Chloroflexota bacterium]